MDTVLVVVNEGAGSGRTEKLETRRRLLEDEGWEQRTVEVPVGLSPALLRSAVRVNRIANREDASVIHSISNPFHLHLVAMVASLLSGRPWLAEFRDPLVTNPDVDPSSWRALARRVVERLIVHTADRVAWLDMIQLPERYFQETYPRVPDDRWLELPPVGYVADPFGDVEPVTTERFTVTYAGSFYEGWIEPYRFLDGLAAYVDRYGEEIRAQFYGDWRPEYDRYAREVGVEDLVVDHEYVPHEEVVPVLCGSDALLYIGGTDDRNRHSVSSKMWDYAGAGRPVLAIAAPEFRVSGFVEEYGVGLAVDPTDPTAVADALHRIESDEFEYSPDESVFEKFTRERNVQELARGYDALLAASN